MPRQRISNGDKDRLIQAHQRGEDYVELARQLEIKRSTAYSIVRRSTEPPRPNTWGGRRRTKMDHEMRTTLQEIVEEHPSYTVDQINHELRLRLPDKPHIQRTTLNTALIGQLLVLKKLEDSPAERNTNETKTRRRDFANWLLNDGIQRQELVYIDEADINLYCSRTRSRAPVGQRAVRVVNGRRGRNLTICFAVSNTRGLLHHHLMEGGMTCELFRAFLQAVSAVAYEDAAFIFDNASAHRRAPTEEVLRDAQVIKMLPPYSPMLNIVENAISTFKASLKRALEEARPNLLSMQHADRMIQLTILAEAHVAAIQPNMVEAWFRKMQSYIPRCLQMDDVVM